MRASRDIRAAEFREILGPAGLDRLIGRFRLAVSDWYSLENLTCILVQPYLHIFCFSVAYFVGNLERRKRKQNRSHSDYGGHLVLVSCRRECRQSGTVGEVGRVAFLWVHNSVGRVVVLHTTSRRFEPCCAHR